MRLSLRQFFIHYLSRKAEGYGPMKPWQPSFKSIQLYQLLSKRTEKVPIPPIYGSAGIQYRGEISQIKSLIHRGNALHIQAHLTYQMGFFFSLCSLVEENARFSLSGKYCLQEMSKQNQIFHSSCLTRRGGTKTV